jgi:hypothetical protein
LVAVCHSLSSAACDAEAAEDAAGGVAEEEPDKPGHDKERLWVAYTRALERAADL